MVYLLLKFAVGKHFFESTKNGGKRNILIPKDRKGDDTIIKSCKGSIQVRLSLSQNNSQQY
jgi:hypothetical protein